MRSATRPSSNPSAWSAVVSSSIGRVLSVRSLNRLIDLGLFERRCRLLPGGGLHNLELKCSRSAFTYEAPLTFSRRSAIVGYLLGRHFMRRSAMYQPRLFSATKPFGSLVPTPRSIIACCQAGARSRPKSIYISTAKLALTSRRPRFSGQSCIRITLRIASPMFTIGGQVVNFTQIFRTGAHSISRVFSEFSPQIQRFAR